MRDSSSGAGSSDAGSQAGLAVMSASWQDLKRCRQLVHSIVSEWKGGTAADVDRAVSENPDLLRHKSIMLDLAYEEYCQLIEQGDSVTASRFCEKYPDIKSSLRHQLEIHKLVGEARAAEDGKTETAWPQLDGEFMDYSIVDELGRGAFARVYLAREKLLGGRFVALKVSSQGALEAETLGKLKHDHIVPIHSVHEDIDTGMTGIVMPYLGRATLSDLLDEVTSGPRLPNRADVILAAVQRANSDSQEPDPGDQPDALLRRGSYLDGVLLLAAQLAEALAHAHKNGILHLDLKPSNVLLTAGGKPMLLDFNLSFDEQIGQRRVGGTLPYMAPEQLQAIAGEDHEGVADERTDIFSAGVLLYELLTGELPIGTIPEEKTAKEIAQKLLERYHVGPRSLRDARAGVSEKISKIVSGCLAVDPADRIQTAEQLASLLRRELRTGQRIHRWVQNHVALSMSLAAAVLIVVTASVVFWATRDPLHVRHYKQARTAFDGGDYEASLQHVDDSLRANPHAVDSIWLRLRTKVALGDFNSAKLELDRLVEIPSERMALIQFAGEELQAGQAAYLTAGYDAACNHFALAALANEQSDEIAVWLARGLEKKDSVQQANEILSEVVKRSPTPGHLAFYAYCLNRAGSHPPAMINYLKAIEAGWDTALIHNNLAYTELKMGRPQIAVGILTAAIERDPTSPSPYVLRMAARFSEAMTDRTVLFEVIHDLERALELTQGSQGKGQILRDLGMLYAHAAEGDAKYVDLAVRHALLSLKFGAMQPDLEMNPKLWALLTDRVSVDALAGDSNLKHLFKVPVLFNPLEHENGNGRIHPDLPISFSAHGLKSEF